MLLLVAFVLSGCDSAREPADPKPTATKGTPKAGLPGLALKRKKGAPIEIRELTARPVILVVPGVDGVTPNDPGDGDAGFGKATRTTIFDYWGVPSHQRWMNGGKFDGGQLTDGATFEIDVEGLVHVSASDEATGRVSKVSLQVSGGMEGAAIDTAAQAHQEIELV